MPCCGIKKPHTSGTVRCPHQNPAVGPRHPRRNTPRAVHRSAVPAPSRLRGGCEAFSPPHPRRALCTPTAGSGSAGSFRTLRARTGSVCIARDAVRMEAESAIISPIMQSVNLESTKHFCYCFRKRTFSTWLPVGFYVRCIRMVSAAQKGFMIAFLYPCKSVCLGY